MNLSSINVQELEVILREENPEIQLIDVRRELIEAKKNQQVYYKTDTHWNQRGAFVGYSKIINSRERARIFCQEL